MENGYLVPSGRDPLALFTKTDLEQQRQFFASRPDLAPTPLRTLPVLARALGLGAVFVKDETSRFGLNAFKTAGATFAVETLRARGHLRAGDTLVCASEGNHGRAVARAARLAGCHARVYLASHVATARIAAIESEGAATELVADGYDEAVRRMARDAEARGWTVISDTSSGGGEEIPRLIMLGYTRLMDEAEASWAPGPPPTLILVPTGVGGLLAAVADWAHQRFGSAMPLIVGVEPSPAACMQTSLRQDRPTTLPGPFDTVMGGLRCGEVSPLAFTVARTLIRALVAIDDRWAVAAMQRLAKPLGEDPVVRAGASGASALGGLLALVDSPALLPLRRALAVGPDTRALLLVTEGTTDPAHFAQVVGETDDSAAEP
ncbi:MAG: diaminopropionate ammonia-lyase [Acidobacteriota bacterium]